MTLKEFEAGLNPCSKVLSRGKATVQGNTVDAIKVKNIYGQHIVWGFFNCDKGKFKGNRLSNNAATEDVVYVEDI